MKKILIFILMLAIFSTGVFGYLTDDNLLYYSFDDGTILLTAVFDLSGNDNFGYKKSINEPVRSEDAWFNQSVKFDGVDDVITINDADIESAIDQAKTYSISTWFKLHSLSDSSQFIYGFYKGSTNRHFLNIHQNGNISGGYYDGTFRALDTPFNDTTSWHHAVVTNDGTNPKFYLDGVQITTQTYDQGLGSSTADFYLGKGGASFGNVSIDEFSIWTIELNASEVEQIYNLTKNFYTPLISGNFTNPATSGEIFNTSFNTTWTAFSNPSGDPVIYDVVFNGEIVCNNISDLTCYINLTGLFNGVYTIQVIANSGRLTSNISTSFTYDTIYPGLVILKPNPDNSSVFSSLTIPVRWGATDSNLYLMNYTLYNNLGTSVYSFQTTGDLSPSYSIDTTKVMPDSGNYTAYFEACDGHTKNKIKDFYDDPGKTQDVNKGLSFNDGNIYVYPIDYSIKETRAIKFNDRYKFEVDSNTNFSEMSFIVASNSPIDYLDYSKYNAHLVTGKYWIDFEEADNDRTQVKVKKYKDQVYPYAYRVDLKFKESKDKFRFESIGELNCINQNVSFVVDEILPINYTFSRFDCPVDTLPRSFTFIGLILIAVLIAMFIMYMSIGIFEVLYGFFLAYIGWTMASCMEFYNILFFIFALMMLLKGIYDGMTKRSTFQR